MHQHAIPSLIAQVAVKVTGDSQKSSVATQVANDVLENVTRDILRMKTLGDPLVSPPVQPTFYFPEYEKCGNEATTVECAPQPVTTLPSGYSYQVSITGLDETTPTDYRDEGLIQVAVTVSGPASAKVVSYVSCYSVYPSPNVNTPAPCRDPAGTPL